MEYREKIIQLLLEDDVTVFNEWLKGHTPMEQVDILRELNAVTEELLPEEMKKTLRPKMAKMTAWADELEEKMLDIQMISLHTDLVEMESERKLTMLKDKIGKLRPRLIEGICNNEPEMEDMKKAALHVISIEKEHGFYDEDNWKEVEGML